MATTIIDMMIQSTCTVTAKKINCICETFSHKILYYSILKYEGRSCQTETFSLTSIREDSSGFYVNHGEVTGVSY